MRPLAGDRAGLSATPGCEIGTHPEPGTAGKFARFRTMDYGVGIAGFSLVCGLLAVIAPVVAVAVILQYLKGPDDRSFSR